MIHMGSHRIPRRVFGVACSLALVIFLTSQLIQNGTRHYHKHFPDFQRQSDEFYESRLKQETSTFLNPSNGNLHDDTQPSRYESNDAWRAADSYSSKHDTQNHRYIQPPPHYYDSKAHYLQQPLVADYPKGAENVFFMIKEGGSVLWKRLPVHLFTTLTRVPNFALYSDAPGSIGGYEVIDILQNVTEETLVSADFDLYRHQRFGHDLHLNVDYSEVERPGAWDLDRFKNIPMLAHAYSVSPQSDWFVFIDGDSFIFMDTLMTWLNTLDPNDPLYLGSRAMLDNMEFAHGGSGVVLSRKAVELTVGTHPEYVREYERKAFNYCCGDYMVALMLKEKLDIVVSAGFEYPNAEYKFQGNSFYEVMVTEDKWCSPITSFHHLSPHDIEILWEYERLKSPQEKASITYGMIYRDFYLPYIVDELKNWNNYADEINYSYGHDHATDDLRPSYEGGIGIRPYESLGACQQACELLEECLAYRYLPNSMYCGLTTTIKLGKPVYDWVKTDGMERFFNFTDATSGWNVNRIRNLRKMMHCDPLYHNQTSEGEKGASYDRTEGWFRRQESHLRYKPDLLTDIFRVIKENRPADSNITVVALPDMQSN